MTQTLIRVRFDLQEDEGVRTISVAIIPQVPDIGETVSIWGHPFIVQRRGWAIGDGADSEYSLYSYVTVVPYKPLPAGFVRSLSKRNAENKN